MGAQRARSGSCGLSDSSNHKRKWGRREIWKEEMGKSDKERDTGDRMRNKEQREGRETKL